MKPPKEIPIQFRRIGRGKRSGEIDLRMIRVAISKVLKYAMQLDDYSARYLIQHGEDEERVIKKAKPPARRVLPAEIAERNALARLLKNDDDE